MLVNDEAKKYLGLNVRGKRYVYNRMPMGCSASPAIFSHFIPQVLSALPDNLKQFVYIYQDDIIVGHDNVNKVNTTKDHVIQLLEKQGCIINLAKSTLEPTTTLEILCYLVSRGKVSVDNNKVLKVIDQVRGYIVKNSITKRQRARIPGRLTFLSLRDPKVQTALEPAYFVLNKQK